MNENLDLTKILDGCPKGTKFYSSVYGELKYSSMYVNSSASEIFFEDNGQRYAVGDSPVIISYRRGGNLFPTKGECTIFPSKDQRDWSKFERFWDKPKIERFDPKTFQPFDKILVRNEDRMWYIDFFVCFDEQKCVNCISDRWDYCIPYNEDTKYLLCTKEDCPNYYKWWESN